MLVSIVLTINKLAKDEPHVHNLVLANGGFEPSLCEQAQCKVRINMHC